MKKPDYYRLEPVYPAAPGEFRLVNAAVGACQLCGEIATGYGASECDICLKCGNLLRRGSLRGIVKHDKGEAIMKMKIEHAKEEDIDKENSILLCMPYGYEGVPGSMTGECEKCGRLIIYAPSSPSLPRKMCMPCGMATIQEIEGKDFEVAITDRQIEEMRKFFAEKKE